MPVPSGKEGNPNIGRSTCSSPQEEGHRPADGSPSVHMQVRSSGRRQLGDAGDRYARQPIAKMRPTGDRPSDRSPDDRGPGAAFTLVSIAED